MNIQTALQIYPLLKEAKLTKITSREDKISIIRSLGLMKCEIEKYEEYQELGLEKLKKENHEELRQKALVWTEQEKNGKEITLSLEEQKSLSEYFSAYAKDVNEYMKQYPQDIEIIVDKISEQSFGELIDSNDWTTSQCELLMGVYI
ncbi:MAG: hypothetical protein HUJ98_04120 [Bacteroidaceae bacterium]|nr:hypothetical protein [Bacteroidaceae bacterium]